MGSNDQINIDTFKIVTKAIAASHNLEIMADHLSQLLVAALEIKGCTIFFLNPETKELEILASFGLSANYLSKGPLQADQSIASTLKGGPVVVRDVNVDKGLQYPEEARREGIGAILSIPIMLLDKPIGVLRLYHYEKWDVSEKDVDSLTVLSEMIGLAIRYTSLLNAVQAFNRSIKGLPVDLD